MTAKEDKSLSACDHAQAGLRHYYLFIIVFLVGTAVMVIELLGTRVLSPWYGSSLYVWSSLITVTLIALSLGYWFGGSLADRVPNRSFLYLIIFAGAVFIFLVPMIAGPVLKTTCTWELRTGCLSSAFIIFGIPLFLLGIVTPFAVKLKAHELKSIGQTAGRLYAISTVGSVAGTLITGFWLIPSMSIKSIFYIISLVLVCIAILGWLLEREWKPIMISFSMTVMAICLIIAQGFCTETKATGIVYRGQSLYGQIRVVDGDTERFLLIDGACQTHLPKDIDAPVNCEYIRTFELLSYYNTSAKDMLIIGLGGGAMLKLFEKYDYEIDVVDINPKSEYVARTFFHTLSRGEKFYVEDGRRFIRNCRKRYDFIIIDFLTIDAFPFHLFSRESFEETRTHLKEGGIVALNSVVYLKGVEVLASQSIYRTLREVFPYVECYTAHFDEESMTCNRVFFASMKELRLKSTRIEELMESRRVTFEKNKGIILRDDFNPLDILFSRTSLEYRKLYLSNFGRETVLDF